MLHTKQFKTAVAIFLALVALNLSPTAAAEISWGGKYLNREAGTVVEYNAVTNTVSSTSDTIGEYYCDEYAWTVNAGQLRCGECQYLPGQAVWESSATQYTYGHCLNMNTVPAFPAPSDAIRYRFDLRELTDEAGEWYLDVRITYWTLYGGEISTFLGDHYEGEIPCSLFYVDPTVGWLHRCDGAVHTYLTAEWAPQGAQASCLELIAFDGARTAQETLVGCTTL